MMALATVTGGQALLGGPQHPQVSAAAALAKCMVCAWHPCVLSSLQVRGDPGPSPGPTVEEGRAFECLRARGCALAQPQVGVAPAPRSEGTVGL